MSSTTTENPAAAATPEAPPAAAASPMELELARLIVSALSLEMEPEEIPPEMPLFDGGLGLDSIDVLELVLELERSFGVQIRDEQTSMEVLRSIDTIADFIMRHRAGNSE